MKTVYDYIASEIMDVIERKRRINKDDLMLAAEIGTRKHTAAMDQSAKDQLIKDERSAIQACAETKRAVEQAKRDDAAKREFYSKSLEQMVSAQRAAFEKRFKDGDDRKVVAVDTVTGDVYAKVVKEPLVKAWWEGASGGGSTWPGPTRTVVIGVDQAKNANASGYYGITVGAGGNGAGGAADWMKA